MKKSTEKEKLSCQQFQLHKLASVYKKDLDLFEEICNYFPFSIYINKLGNLDSVYFNHEIQTVLGADELIKVKTKGHEYVRSISDKQVLAHNLITIKKFNDNNDPYAVCSYLQRLLVKNEMTWLPTFKVLLGDDFYLNILYQMSDFGRIGDLLEDLLGNTLVKRNGWEIFSSLTKREKEILRLLANGYTSKQISEYIHIAKTTVDTHRRNIFEKLEVKTYAQLFKFAQTFELIEYNK